MHTAISKPEFVFHFQKHNFEQIDSQKSHGTNEKNDVCQRIQKTQLLLTRYFQTRFLID